MKFTITLLKFSIALILYSCNSGDNHKEENKNPIQEQHTETKTDNCYFSEEEIGINSNDKSQIKLIGLFENLNNTEDHTYGYALKLWKLDDEILGFLNLYEGSLESDRSGPIIKGKIINDSLYFTVWTKQSKGFKDWQQSDVHVFSFTGRILNDTLIGRFSMYDCSNKTLYQDYDKQVELPSSDMWELKSFKNIKDWKEDNSYELEYEK